MKADISKFQAILNEANMTCTGVCCFNENRVSRSAVSNGVAGKTLSGLLRAAMLGGALYGGYHFYDAHKNKDLPAPEENVPQVVQTEYKTPFQNGVDKFKATDPLWDSKLRTLLTGAGLVAANGLVQARRRKKAAAKAAANANAVTENQRTMRLPGKSVSTKNALWPIKKQANLPVAAKPETKKKMPMIEKLLLGTALAAGLNHSPQAFEGIKEGLQQHKAEATRSVTGREAQESHPTFFKTAPNELRGIKKLVNDQPDDVVMAMLNYVSNPTQDAYKVISTMVQGIPGRSDLWEKVKQNPDAAKDILQYSMQERYMNQGESNGWRAPSLN